MHGGRFHFSPIAFSIYTTLRTQPKLSSRNPKVISLGCEGRFQMRTERFGSFG
jgi:hypothetical protein